MHFTIIKNIESFFVPLKIRHCLCNFVSSIGNFVCISAGAGRGEQPKVFGSMAAKDEFSIDDSIGDEEDLIGDNLDDDDLKALDMGM